MNKKKGFTLVELLVVMGIVAILTMMMVGILNPAALVNKGRDAQRKKDLNRIKIAFEEYFNDKGYYPQDVSDWNIKSNCHSTNISFSPYLSPWPCDPNGNPYRIIMETNKFRVLANLENKKDNDIPAYWYERTDLVLNGLTVDQVSYGVSSSNILWYDTYINPECDFTRCAQEDINIETCRGVSNSIGCNSVANRINCYYPNEMDSCLPQCKVSCCGNGCN